jgi:hypothetical protein
VWVRELRLDETGCPGWASANVREALTQPVEDLGIADRYRGLQLIPRLQLRKIEHRVNEARPTPSRKVTRFHVDNDPHRTRRLWTFHVSGRYDAATYVDLYALMPLGHGEDPF